MSQIHRECFYCNRIFGGYTSQIAFHNEHQKACGEARTFVREPTLVFGTAPMPGPTALFGSMPMFGQPSRLDTPNQLPTEDTGNASHDGKGLYTGELPMMPGPMSQLLVASTAPNMPETVSLGSEGPTKFVGQELDMASLTKKEVETAEKTSRTEDGITWQAFMAKSDIETTKLSTSTSYSPNTLPPNNTSMSPPPHLACIQGRAERFIKDPTGPTAHDRDDVVMAAIASVASPRAGREEVVQDTSITTSPQFQGAVATSDFSPHTQTNKEHTDTQFRVTKEHVDAQSRQSIQAAELHNRDTEFLANQHANELAQVKKEHSEALIRVMTDRARTLAQLQEEERIRVQRKKELAQTKKQHKELLAHVKKALQERHEKALEQLKKEYKTNARVLVEEEHRAENLEIIQALEKTHISQLSERNNPITSLENNKDNLLPADHSNIQKTLERKGLETVIAGLKATYTTITAENKKLDDVIAERTKLLADLKNEQLEEKRKELGDFFVEKKKKNNKRR